MRRRFAAPVFVLILSSAAVPLLGQCPPNYMIDNWIQVGYPTTNIAGYPALNPLTNRLYVPINSSHAASVVDTSTDTTIATFPIPYGLFPQRALVDPSTNLAYFTTFRDPGSLAVLNGADNTFVTSVAVGRGTSQLAFNPLTRRIYIGNNQSNTVSVVDADTHSLITNIPFTQPAILEVNVEKNLIYVTRGSTPGLVSIIDGATNTVTGSITVGAAPFFGIALNSANRKLYVANYDGNDVTVIDTDTHTVTGTIKVGLKPRAIVIDPATNLAYVANRDSRSLTIIDSETDRVIGEAYVELQPLGFAIHPVTQKIYVGGFSNYVAVLRRFTARETLDVIATQIEALSPWSLNQGQLNALLATLTNAMEALDRGDTQKAITFLRVFEQQLNAFVRAGVLLPYMIAPIQDLLGRARNSAGC